jgi:hypothetical protein
MKFREETIKEFNSYRDATLTEDMTFADAVENIENANNSYFYISLSQNDVIEAINNEKEIAEQFDLDLIYLLPQGIAIALQV